MKCPRCDAALSHVRKDLYECPQCLLVGTYKEVTELTSAIQRVDAIIEAKEAEKEYLLDARREAVIRGNTTYLQKVLLDNDLNPGRANPGFGSVQTKKMSHKRKLGLMLASIELGAFMDWLVNNFYIMMDGKLSLTQSVVPFIFLFQSIILLIVSYE